MNLRTLALGAASFLALACANTSALAANAFADANGIVTQFTTNTGSTTVGVSNPAQGNCYPFSCFASQTPAHGVTYQQVYTSQAFSGLVTISAVSFFDNTLINNGNGNMDSASYDVSFWDTSLAPSGLTTSAAANRGVLLSNFGSFSLGGAMPLTLTLNGAAFNYDPSAGNLLMQVKVTGLTVSQPYQSFFQVDTTGATTSRYFDYAPSGTPEPAAWALMLVGFGGLGAMLRRQRHLGAASA